MKRKNILSIMMIAVLLLIVGAAIYMYNINKPEDFVTEGHTAASVPAYQEKLFDTGKTGLIRIDISDEDWSEITDNAYAENYVSCDITINGETVENVGIRAKGNASLLISSLSGTDRQGFKIEFDHYVDGQTYEGLDKMVLNSGINDPTFMKEALSYDIFEYMGVPCALHNYVKVMVNGEYLGLYLALEGIEDSFLEREYGDSAGELYKPDSESVDKLGESVGAGSSEESSLDLSDMYMGWTEDEFAEQQEKAMDFSAVYNSSQNITETTDTDSDDADEDDQPDPVTALRYVGDDPEDYDLIWGSSVTDTDDEDHLRVISDIKYISENPGGKLNSVLDVDGMLRYMAVQTFIVSLDHIYAGNNHNYYLYEQDGRITMLPWDYNESFGGCFVQNVAEYINYPIDTPYYNVDIANEEFFEAILSNEDYRAQYHEYLRQICEEYVLGGKLDEEYSSIRENIDGALEEDPTSFYIYEVYDKYAPDQISLLKLRAKSVLGQLDGSIPSTTEGQADESDKLITFDETLGVEDANELNFYSRADALLDKIGMSMSSMFGGNTRIGYIMVHLKDMTYEEYKAWSRSYIYSYVQVPADYYEDEIWTGDWSEIEAGGQTLTWFGCGLCCLTNTYDTLVASSSETGVVTPATIYLWAKERASYNPESGTGALSWQQLKKMCQSFGLSAKIMKKTGDYSAFQRAVSQNDTTIALVCKDNDDKLWPYTNGHYISLWEYDEDTDTVFVTDSSGAHNRERVALEDIYRALKTSSKAQYLSINKE